MNPQVLAAVQWAKKHAPVVAAGGILAVTAAVYPVVREHDLRKADARVRQLAADNIRLKNAAEESERKYSDLEKDRNNILERTRTLLEERSKWTEAADEMDALRKANGVITAQKDKLLGEMQKAKSDLETVSGHFTRLKAAFQELKTRSEALETEASQLRQAMGRKVEASPQYQALDKDAKALRSTVARLESTVKSLEGKLKAANERIAKIQDRDRKFAKQIDIDRKTIRELKAEKDRLTKVNAEMNKLAAEAPARFKDIAEENRRLVKETGEMHYNMGVFFLQKRNVTMAERELKRAVEIDPNNAKAHYNLGYLYSEEMDKHDLAILHFNKFLQIRPSGKESEVVRSYLLMRQAYGDSAPRK